MFLKFCLFLCCVSPFSIEASLQKINFGPQLTVPPAIHSNLTALANEASEFHSAMQEGNPFFLKRKILELQKRIQSIYEQLPLITHPQKKNLAFRLLGIIDEKLEGLKIQGREQIGTKNVKKLFSTIVELTQIYNVKTASNGIFYCSRDKSLWLQAGRKPKNPVSPHLKNCGRRVW